MRKIITLFFFAALLCSTTQASLLDQSQDSEGGFGIIYDQRSLSQTFVPAITGQLVKVEVCLWKGSTPYPLTLSIVETVNGLPNGEILGSQQIGVKSDWNAVDFQSYPTITLIAGHEYAIVMESDHPKLALPFMGSGWYGDWNDNLYSAGRLLEFKSSVGHWETFELDSQPAYGADGTFKTYMIPAPIPEPTTITLLALGAFLAGRKRRN